jgi:hypothetical protein
LLDDLEASNKLRIAIIHVLLHGIEEEKETVHACHVGTIIQGRDDRSDISAGKNDIGDLWVFFLFGSMDRRV